MNKQIIIDYEEYLELEKIKKFYNSIYNYVYTKSVEVGNEKRKERIGTWHFTKYDYACDRLEEILRYIRVKEEDVKNETESKGE